MDVEASVQGSKAVWDFGLVKASEMVCLPWKLDALRLRLTGVGALSRHLCANETIHRTIPRTKPSRIAVGHGLTTSERNGNTLPNDM